MGLREGLTKHVAEKARDAEGGGSPDPNKRQRKATKMFEAAPSHTPRAKGTSPPKPKVSKAKAAEPGVGEKDPSLPKPPQTAYMYFSREMRPALVAELTAASETGAAPAFTDVGRLCGEKWKQVTPEVKGRYEMIAAADKERCAPGLLSSDTHHPSSSLCTPSRAHLPPHHPVPIRMHANPRVLSQV